MFSDLANNAYFAGLFDGEGYVNVRPRGVAIRVQMMDAAPIAWLHETFGGKRYEHSTAAYRGKVCHAWHLATAREVNELLAATCPYLLTKRGEAEAVIAFNEYRLTHKLDIRLPTYTTVKPEYDRLRDAIGLAKRLRSSYPLRDTDPRLT